MKNNWAIKFAAIILFVLLAVIPLSAQAQPLSEQDKVSLEIPDGAKAGRNFDVEQAGILMLSRLPRPISTC